MRSVISPIFVVSLLASAAAQTTTNPVTGTLGNASVVEDNPPGPIYTATLPETEFFNPNDPRGNVKGTVSATANPNGIGVVFQVNFENLPTSGGPFLYHLHAFPVPADGNCTDTLGHLDPYIRGETPACDQTLPQTCQVGDLAGKHGKITSDPFTASYTDEFASTLEGIGAFFGNRSVVVHFANTTRITCANFTLVGGAVGGNPNATSTGSPSATSSGPAQFTGDAATTPGHAAVSVIVLGVVAMAIMVLA